MEILYYLIFINLFTAILFVVDKIKAGMYTRRIPEKYLHLLELLGGALVVLPLMYIIRHKNRKLSYSLITAILFFAWLYILISLWQKEFENIIDLKS